MFWIINFGIGLIDYILHTLLACRAEHIFKTRYPELKIPKSHWTKAVMTRLKMVVMYLCPVINILFVFVYLFKDDELCERTVSEVYRQAIEEV